jgi:hypothetical protein
MFVRILAALAFAGVCMAQCSQEMVRGTWAAQYLGTNMVTAAGSSTAVATPAAELILIKVDYQGSFTGAGYASIGGQVTTVSLSGNIQVNADCIASSTYTMSAAGKPLSGIGSDRLLVLASGTEMRAMTLSGLLGSPSGITYYRRVSWSDPQCAQGVMHGAYGVTWEGTFGMVAGGQTVVYPYSQMGAGAYDYSGKGNGLATMSLGGRIIPSAIPDLTVTVNDDCTGLIKYSVGSMRVVVLNGGDELLAILEQITGGSPTAIGKFKRMSPIPVAPKW